MEGYAKAGTEPGNARASGKMGHLLVSPKMMDLVSLKRECVYHPLSLP